MWPAALEYRSSASPRAKRTRASKRKPAGRLGARGPGHRPPRVRSGAIGASLPGAGPTCRRLSFGPRCTGSTVEGSTRAPVTPTLSIPAPHRRYDGLVGSVLLHLLLLGLLIHRGDRLWSAT